MRRLSTYTSPLIIGGGVVVVVVGSGLVQAAVSRVKTNNQRPLLMHPIHGQVEPCPKSD
jgi:hypothetical protein